METTADRLSALAGDDGQRFPDPFVEALHRYRSGFSETAPSWGDPERFEFADGSAIVVAGECWDRGVHRDRLDAARARYAPPEEIFGPGDVEARDVRFAFVGAGYGLRDSDAEPPGVLCTDEASGGARVRAPSFDEYVADALADQGAYNQGEDGVSTLVRAWSWDEEGNRAPVDGWIDFAADVDVSGAIRILQHADGMRVDWTHDAGGVAIDANWGADTTHEEIAASVDEAIAYLDDDDRGRVDRDEAIDYWAAAVEAARVQREYAASALAELDTAAMPSEYDGAPDAWDSGALARAREHVRALVECEQEFGDSHTYGPALAALGDY